MKVKKRIRQQVRLMNLSRVVPRNTVEAVADMTGKNTAVVSQVMRGEYVNRPILDATIRHFREKYAQILELEKLLKLEDTADDFSETAWA